MNTEDLYKLFDLPEDTCLEDLEKARRIQLKTSHPDRFGSDAEMRSIAEKKPKKLMMLMTN